MLQQNEITVRTAVREKVRHYINGRSFRISILPRRFNNKSIYSVAMSAQRKRFLPESLVAAIGEVGLHNGTFLQLKNAVKVPVLLDRINNRRLIRRSPEDNNWSFEAARQVEWYLGAAGYIPLVEHCEGGPSLFVHAQGIEIGQERFNLYPHKLPYVYSTIAPHKPFGPSLFGRVKAHKMDAICPDIVAYICIDHSDIRKHLGPYLFPYDSISENLNKDTREHFLQTKYNIGPDPTISPEGERNNGFGGVSRIKVFGERGKSSGNGDGRKYMRFIQDRMKHPLNEDGDLKILWTTIKGLEDRQEKPLDLERGDVLLINNRRVAQRWRSRGDYRGWLPGQLQREHLRLQERNRTILRMSFYYPEEIPP